MKKMMVQMRNWIDKKPGNWFAHLFLFGTFVIPDIWLRVVTRWIGAYSIYEPAPNLFTLLWAMVLTVIITAVPSRKAGRILYGAVYYLFAVYAVVQYGAYLLLGKFLYVSDFMFAGEGADYASWVIDLLTPGFLLQIGGLTIFGAVGVIIYPSCDCKHIRNVLVRVLVVVLCAIAMIQIPRLYGEVEGEDRWDGFSNLALEYTRFTNANTDMELTGMYQYLFRDIQIQLERTFKDHTAEIEMIDAYFEQKTVHEDNPMTGVLAGKNLIVVMMETMDDWMITENDTPTLYRMMTEGIGFTNFYTPDYSSGYTFNTEFAFNTSTYPYTNGNTAYSLVRNTFGCSIGNLLSSAGYTSNSYHEGKADFYNRGQMHNAWGYEKYHSYQNYVCKDIDYLDDRFLTACDDLYADLMSQFPFYSFVISYSPHLPYTDDDPLTRIALELYPQYDVVEDREVAILRAKARLTDDMFASLLARLEEDGMLENTVIVGFGDHYAYGLSDKERLQQLSEEAGNSILERTPAFIYCAGTDLSMEVDKVMQITDLAPTILNLFGLDVPTEIMGRDIFDENYQGHVIFANGSWLTGSAYFKNGVIQWNNGMTEEEIAEMNAYVQRVYQVNDAILDSDYYAG